MKYLPPLTISLLLCVLAGTLVLRPYSTDVLRYAWWRLTGPSYVKGSVQSGDASISFAVTGSGSPLILLHGGLSSSLDWYAELPELSKRFKVILVDSRGHGGSSLGEGRLDYKVLTDDVVAVLDSLDLNKVDLLGWSDGGNVGLLLALNHPTRVRRLVAISANSHPDGLTEDALHSIAQIESHGPSWFSKLLYRIQSPDHRALDRLREEVTSMWTGTSIISNVDLKLIETPTLLIIGAEDDVVIEHAQLMQSLMPHAELKVIPKVDHNVPQAAAERVLESTLTHFGRE